MTSYIFVLFIHRIEESYHKYSISYSYSYDSPNRRIGRLRTSMPTFVDETNNENESTGLTINDEKADDEKMDIDSVDDTTLPIITPIKKDKKKKKTSTSLTTAGKHTNEANILMEDEAMPKNGNDLESVSFLAKITISLGILFGVIILLLERRRELTVQEI